MKNNNWKLFIKAYNKEENIIRVAKTKRELIKFLDYKANEKLVEKYGEEFKNIGKQLKFDMKRGIEFIDPYQNLNVIKIPDASGILVERDIDVDINVWSSRLFNNSESVLDQESDGNTALYDLLYAENIEKLKKEFSEYNWDNLMLAFKNDLGQMMRHLIVTFKFPDGSRIMIHFTHSVNIKKILMLDGESIGINRIETYNVNSQEQQYISNPTQISEEFYERIFNSEKFMENVINSVGSRLNEEILTNLGISSNQELGNRILNFLNYLDSFGLQRGVNYYEGSDYNADEIIGDYCYGEELNEELSEVLNKIFFLYINGK